MTRPAVFYVVAGWLVLSAVSLTAAAAIAALAAPPLMVAAFRAARGASVPDQEGRPIHRILFTIAVVAAVLAPASVAADRVDNLSTRTLEREARAVGAGGGVRCHTTGVGAACATPYLRRLVRELVERRFLPHGPVAVRWALCVAARESGLNPAAVSRTDDHGVGQLNRPSHPWVDYPRIAWRTSSSPTGWASDPVYSVAVFVRLARGGHNRGPWEAAPYSCY